MKPGGGGGEGDHKKERALGLPLYHVYCELPQCITSVCMWSGGSTWDCPHYVVVCPAVVTLQPRSTAPTVAGCRLVGCSVVSGLPLHSRTVSGVSLTSVSAWGQFWPPMLRPLLLLQMQSGEGWVWFPYWGGVVAE